MRRAEDRTTRGGLKWLAGSLLAAALSTTASAGDGPEFELDLVDDCIQTGSVPGQIFVELRMKDIDPDGNAAAGYQAFIRFDPDKITFVEGKYTQSPFGLPIASPIHATADGLLTLAAGVDVFGGQAPTYDDAVLATLRFAPKGEDCDVTVDFCTDGSCQENIITDIGAQPLQGLEVTGTDSFSIDGTAPRINVCCPAGEPLPANSQCKASVPDLSGCVQASDNCTAAADLDFTQMPAAGSAVGLGTTWVTIFVADCAGNTSMCQTPITVVDGAAPQITSCPGDRILKVDNSCTTRVPNLLNQVSAIDNCDNPSLLTISQDPPADTEIGLGDTTVIISITDNDGNTAQCSLNLDVVDADGPKIAVCPNGLDLAGSGPDCSATLPDFTANIIAVDNCTLKPLLEIEQSHEAGSTVPFGTTIVTVTVTDQAGLSDTCAIQVNVLDLEPPVISACNQPESLTLGTNCRATLGDLTGLVLASDSCGDVVISQSKPAGTEILGKGTISITLTVTDESGNTSQCEVQVSTVDLMPPVIAQCSNNVKIPGDQDCNGTVPQMTGGVVAVDNCPGQVLITQDPVAGTAIIGKGITPVVITATDVNGNAITCDVNVIIEDNTDPILECPENITAECMGPDGAFVGFDDQLNATDNCGDVSVNCFLLDESGVFIGIVNPDGTQFPNKERSFVLCRATDEQGNISDCIFTVTVDDTVAPVIGNTPERVVLDANSQCKANIPDFLAQVTATDACDENPVITQNPPVGSSLNGKGLYEVTITATDNRGNSSSEKIQVEVADNTAPQIVQCAGDLEIKVNERCLGQLPDLRGGLKVLENCGEFTIQQSPAPSAELERGTHTVTLTARDDQGNESTCEVMVSVVDMTDPKIFECAGAVTIDVDEDCVARAPELEVVAFDDCDDADDLEITQSPEALAPLALGDHTILVTATDTAGNSDTCEVLVSVVDNEAPQLVCPDDRSEIAQDDLCSAPVKIGEAEATDNCGVEKISAERSDGEALDAAFPLGDTTITWRAVDEAGNEVTCEQTVTVEDDTAPMLSCPSNISVEAEAGICTRQLNPGQATARDSCDGNVSVTFSRNDGLDLDDPYSQGTTTITWTATDDSGNSIQCAQFINVSPVNTLFVDIDLEANLHAGPLERCITFELVQCGGGAPIEVSTNVTFVNGSARNFEVPIPCGEYSCISARDDLHTITRTDFGLAIGAGGVYEADFTGARRLVGGNLNGDDRIDIFDWAIFAGQFLGAFADGGNTECDSGFDPQTNPHADVSGNGFVFVEDHTFISANFRAMSDPDCCTPQGVAGAADDSGTYRISVDELYRLRLGHLAVADLNHDGFVDEQDMQAFDAGVQPQPVREFAGQPGSSWFEAGNWANGLQPDALSDVSIPVNVVIDREGALARSVRVAQGGGLTITGGALTATAITVESGGTLRLDDAAAYLEAASITLEEGAILEWNAGTVVIDGGVLTSAEAIFVGEGLLEIVNGGRIVAPHVIAGPLGEIVIDGTVEGDLTNDGLLRPEFVTVDGRFGQSATGELEIELGGLLDALGQDVLVVLGTADLDGALTVALVDGFTPQVGDRFEIIHATAVNGRFASLELPALGNGLRFRVVYGEDRVALEVIRPARRTENPLGSH